MRATRKAREQSHPQPPRSAAGGEPRVELPYLIRLIVAVNSSAFFYLAENVNGGRPKRITSLLMSPQRHQRKVRAYGDRRGELSFFSEAKLPKCDGETAVARASFPRIQRPFRKGISGGFSVPRGVHGPSSCILPGWVRIPKINPAKKSAEGVFWGGPQKSPTHSCRPTAHFEALGHVKLWPRLRKRRGAKDLEKCAPFIAPRIAVLPTCRRRSFLGRAPRNSLFFCAPKKPKKSE